MLKTDAPETSHLAGLRRWRSSAERSGGRFPLLWRAGISALIACGPVTAQAQGTDAGAAATGMKAACRTDYRAHCVGSDPAAPIAAACLSQFYLNLSKNCQAALDAYNAPKSEAEPE